MKNDFMYKWHRVSYKYFDEKEKAEQFIMKHKDQTVYELSWCGNFIDKKVWKVTRNYKN